MNERADREAKRRDIANKRVVCQPREMDTIRIRRSLSFRSASGTELLMDVYYPSLSDRPVPLVVMCVAYPDPTAQARAFGPLTSWAHVLAASGMAAVVYGTEAPAQDLHALLACLRADSRELGLDADRVGLFAASGNVTVGLATVMRDRRLRCGAFLYGYTMDMDGSAAVARMSQQFGFVDACTGKSIDELPDTPVLFVRAGQDHFPGLNAALDKVIGRGLARNLPLSFVNHAAGAHGFDVDEDTSIARGIVRQVVAFLQLHLGATTDDSATLKT